MGPFGLCQRFEPVGDFVKTFVAGFARHSRIHVGVFMGFAGHSRFQVIRRGADGLTRRRIACFFQVFQMAVRMAGFTFRGRAENGRDIVESFNVGLLREIKITAVRLGFTGKGVFEVLFGLGSTKSRHCHPPCSCLLRR